MKNLLPKAKTPCFGTLIKNDKFAPPSRLIKRHFLGYIFTNFHKSFMKFWWKTTFNKICLRKTSILSPKSHFSSKAIVSPSVCDFTSPNVPEKLGRSTVHSHWFLLAGCPRYARAPLDV